MRDLAKGMKKLNEEEVFEELKDILKEVAPLKVIGKIELDSSLVDDFAFDSIDIMDTLLKIQQVFFTENTPPMDVDNFIKEAYGEDSSKAMVVKSICEFIMKVR